MYKRTVFANSTIDINFIAHSIDYINIYCECISNTNIGRVVVVENYKCVPEKQYNYQWKCDILPSDDVYIIKIENSKDTNCYSISNEFIIGDDIGTNPFIRISNVTAEESIFIGTKIPIEFIAYNITSVNIFLEINTNSLIEYKSIANGVQCESAIKKTHYWVMDLLNTSNSEYRFKIESSNIVSYSNKFKINLTSTENVLPRISINYIKKSNHHGDTIDVEFTPINTSKVQVYIEGDGLKTPKFSKLLGRSSVTPDVQNKYPIYTDKSINANFEEDITCRVKIENATLPNIFAYSNDFTMVKAVPEILINDVRTVQPGENYSFKFTTKYIDAVKIYIHEIQYNKKEYDTVLVEQFNVTSGKELSFVWKCDKKGYIQVHTQRVPVIYKLYVVDVSGRTFAVSNEFLIK